MNFQPLPIQLQHNPIKRFIKKSHENIIPKTHLWDQDSIHMRLRNQQQQISHI
eukprot:TRINITY_DN10060_c0_g1_i1.p2 TRINITY_DN10060_c0_g1~~TRINITY_DN10060_c0_g1_i1.p2  ORF type:complete len:53 (-),score=7.30 TRINITY_DN10060_c0_g1_i1:17-175(-)